VCRLDAVVQSVLRYTLITSASTGLTVEGLAPLLDHVTITQCSSSGIDYKLQGWGLLTMLECNVSHNSQKQLTAESRTTQSTDRAVAVYLHRYASLRVRNAEVINY